MYTYVLKSLSKVILYVKSDSQVQIDYKIPLFRPIYRPMFNFINLRWNWDCSCKCWYDSTMCVMPKLESCYQ